MPPIQKLSKAEWLGFQKDSKSIKRRHDYKSNETKQNRSNFQLPAAQQLDRHFVLFSVILPNVVTPKKREKIHDKKFI